MTLSHKNGVLLSTVGAINGLAVTSIGAINGAVRAAVVAPTRVGSIQYFTSIPTTPTVTRSVAAGSLVLLGFNAANGDPAALTITDDQGGSNASWLNFGGNTTDPNKGGVRGRFFPSVVITIGKDGGTSYVGACLEYASVHSTVTSGVPVYNYTGTSPNVLTPSNTLYDNTTVVSFLACTSSNYATGFSYSDTNIGSTDDQSLGRQLQICERVVLTAGSTSAFSYTYTNGTSGDDPRSTQGIYNLRPI